MAFPTDGTVWMNGQLVPWGEAKIHIASHVVHYASAVFEGVRCYGTSEGPAVFRLDAHTRRLYDSARVYRMLPALDPDAFNQAVVDTIAANNMWNGCYIRPLIYRGYGQLGVNPLPNPIDVAILVWEWGKYLGDAALDDGIDVRISSWNRMAPNTLPAMAKSAANYMNSQLIKMEALKEGYEEGIALDREGYLSEGSGENLFLVRRGKLVTPPVSSAALPGITRDSVLTLAREFGIPVVEERVPRELIYLADELFFTGTAAEITPIRSVDKIQIGAGRRGPVTRQLQEAFFDVVTGRTPDTRGWLTYVPRPAAVAAGAAARMANAG
jgi:branched-chain amino acid aminotransferase